MARGFKGVSPQFPQCRAIFPSTVEYQDHLQTCWARASVTSTEASTGSPDVEVLSCSNSESESWDGGGGGMVPPIAALPGPSSSPVRERTISEGGGSSVGAAGGKRRRDKDGGERLHNGGERARHLSGGSRDLGSATLRTGYENSPPYATSSNSYFSTFSEQEDEDSDEDEVVEYSIGEMARLLSLNEQDMFDGDSSDDEEAKGEAAAKRASMPHTSFKSPGPKRRSLEAEPGSLEASKPTTSTHRLRLEPVGVFWDIENCPVPVDKSAFGVADKMRREFITGKREAEFMCVCDITKERKEVTDELHKAQVRGSGVVCGV